ncbi:hypothetical protein, partial [Shewanella sp.]|uniref:hypothetical protein n=1 Tax=Shewanella sp. TaxID=50422 RepID=UPI0040547140
MRKELGFEPLILCLILLKLKCKKATLMSGFLCLVGGLRKELGFEPLILCLILLKLKCKKAT